MLLLHQTASCTLKEAPGECEKSAQIELLAAVWCARASDPESERDSIISNKRRHMRLLARALWSQSLISKSLVVVLLFFVARLAGLCSPVAASQCKTRTLLGAASRFVSYRIHASQLDQNTRGTRAGSGERLSRLINHRTLARRGSTRTHGGFAIEAQWRRAFDVRGTQRSREAS